MLDNQGLAAKNAQLRMLLSVKIWPSRLVAVVENYTVCESAVQDRKNYREQTSSFGHLKLHPPPHSLCCFFAF